MSAQRSRGRELVAYIDGEQVGLFTQNAAGAIEFVYGEDRRPEMTRLSISMPSIGGARYGNRVARPFLQGLLSDNPETLEALAAAHHTSPGPMNLLRYVGRDTAGALQLLPPGVHSDDAALRTGDVRYLDDFDDLIADVASEAGDWVRNRDEIRWSLAGAQPKVALYRAADGRWGVPQDSTPTTHILKPAARGRRHDLNEFVTMRAARILGLDVADHEILTTERGDHVFIGQRYDRVVVDGALRRLHQEDFAQALAVDPAYKYQIDGGPGVGDFARVLNAFPATVRETARMRLFEALVFSIASVNTDAHAKNYSVIHYRTQMRLAPLYDLGSNVLYQGGQPITSAVTMGGERVMDRIGRRELLKVAKTLGLEAERAEGVIERIRSGVAAAYLSARDDVLTDPAGSQYVAELVDAIAARAKARGWIG